MYKLFVLLLLLVACSDKQESNQGEFELKKEDRVDLQSLHPYFELMDSVESGDWLSSHEEHYVSLDDYIAGNPRRPSPLRNIIYIQPIGNIDSAGMYYINKTKEFFENFFALKVKINEKLSSDIVPKEHRRSFNNSEQLKTKYILYDVLKPSMHGDAVAVIALTDHDLYPADDWNFVFGQASVKEGVGVWSYFHFGDPHDTKNQLQFLTRLLKTAGHETCHMFSIKHCISFKCLMNGSNSMYESDHHPPYLCPECLQKLCYNLGMDPKEHFSSMQKFWKENNNPIVADFYKTLLEKSPD